MKNYRAINKNKIIKTTAKKQNHSNQKLFLLLLVIAVSVGAFVRTFRLTENLVFHGELGHNYLAVRDIIASKQIPLIGPPTSHPWLWFGPLFYWIMVPVMLIGNYNPESGAWLMAILASVTLILNYEVAVNIFSKKTGLISTILMSISPLWLILFRQARFFALTAILWYPFFLVLMSILEHKNKSTSMLLRKYLLAGIIFGFMLNFHYTPIALLPGLVVLLYPLYKKTGVQPLFRFTLGVLAALSPLMMNELQNNFSMTTKFLSWIPYRIGGFMHLLPTNQFSAASLIITLERIGEFFLSQFVPPIINGSVLFIIGILSLLFVTTELVKEFQKKDLSSPYRAILVLGVSVFISLLIHGSPPAHYFVAIYPIPILIVSVFLSRTFDNEKIKKIVPYLIGVIVLINLSWIFSKYWLFADQSKVTSDGRVPYQLQVKIAKTILHKAEGKPFSLNRYGNGDTFAGNYAQNYRYLLWRFGNEPKENQSLRFTIYEDITRLPTFFNQNEIVYHLSNAAIVVEQPIHQQSE